MTLTSLLYVEDTEIWRKRVSESLREILGIKVDTADSYSSGKSLLDSNGYDLVISDGLEGECFRFVREANLPKDKLVIFSSSTIIRSEAKTEGIKFYDKDHFETYESFAEAIRGNFLDTK